MRVALALCAALAIGCGARESAESRSVPAPAPRPAPAPPPKPAEHWLDQEIALARSTTGTPLTPGLPAIALTVRELRLLGSDEYALPVPPASEWQSGFGAEHKRTGPNDLFVVPLGAWLAETRREDERDISVVVDRTMPFRLLMEVLFTAAQSHYPRFHLIVQSGSGPREIVIEAPRAENRDQASFLVSIAGAGVALKTPSGNVAPGCTEHGVGVTVPRRRGRLDSLTLGGCLTELSETAPEVRVARLTAESSTPFVEVVETLDVVRTVSALQSVMFGVSR